MDELIERLELHRVEAVVLGSALRGESRHEVVDAVCPRGSEEHAFLSSEAMQFIPETGREGAAAAAALHPRPRGVQEHDPCLL
jgi:hypothetical protein